MKKRIRQWFIWFGGWEFPYHGFRTRMRIGDIYKWLNPRPIALFGYRFIIYDYSIAIKIWKLNFLDFSWSPLSISFGPPGMGEDTKFIYKKKEKKGNAMKMAELITKEK